MTSLARAHHQLLLAVHREWQLLRLALVEEGEVTMIWYKISTVTWLVDHWMVDLEGNMRSHYHHFRMRLPHIVAEGKVRGRGKWVSSAHLLLLT